MSWLSSLPVLGGVLEKGMEKLFPDKAKAREQQAEIDKAEIAGAPPSRLRLWRSFLGWVLALLFVWEVVFRTVISTYWPGVKLPPSVLKEITSLLLGMLGLGF